MFQTGLGQGFLGLGRTDETDPADEHARAPAVLKEPA
jgi:hypothetical protein